MLAQKDDGRRCALFCLVKATNTNEIQPQYTIARHYVHVEACVTKIVQTTFCELFARGSILLLGVAHQLGLAPGVLLHHGPLHWLAKVVLCAGWVGMWRVGMVRRIHMLGWWMDSRTDRFWANVRWAALNSGVVNVSRGSSCTRASSICMSSQGMCAVGGPTVAKTPAADSPYTCTLETYARICSSNSEAAGSLGSALRSNSACMWDGTDVKMPAALPLQCTPWQHHGNTRAYQLGSSISRGSHDYCTG